MLVMRVFVVRLCFKFEVRRPSRSRRYDAPPVSALGGLVTLTFDLETGAHYLLFLRASAMLKHVIDIGWTMDVRPSVCLSHAGTAEYIVMLSSPHDSPFILVLCISRSSRNSDGTPCGAAKQMGYKKWQFSTKNLLYLRNG